MSDTLTGLIERFYNELHDAQGSGSYSSTDFELPDFMIWEFFIATTAILLHYEHFSDLHDLLVHPYFLKQNYFNTSVDAFGYFKFRAYPRIIEEICKPKSSNPNRYTMSGDILINRERKPLLTKESISNADIILYQLGCLLPIPEHESLRSYWFPMTYVYHESPQLIWQKLKSTKHCLKVAPLLGAKTVEQLKDIVKESTGDRDMRHSGACGNAPGILNSIKLEEIGSML